MLPPPDRAGHTGRWLLWLLLLGLLAAQVWGLYLLVPGEGDPFFAGQDKVAHALLFGMPFGLALWLGSRPMAGLILLHALVSEPLQGLVTTTRTADAWDLLADLAGIGVASAVVLVLRARAGRAEVPGAREAAEVRS